MKQPTLGTSATAAHIFAGILAASGPVTASEFPRTLSDNYVRPAQKATSRISSFARLPQNTASINSYVESYTEASDSEAQLDRLTTAHERLIGEIRSWGVLGADWDGEGALAPSATSIIEAVSLSRLFSEADYIEPMLLASGHVSLYINENGLYADIEFLGDGRIAYFIKRHGDKHKGVLTFDSQKMPAVFQALIEA